MKGYLWNMLTTIKNGQMSKKNVVLGRKTNLCESILKIMWDEGFITGYRVSKDNVKNVEIFLKYTESGLPIIRSLKFFSKPGNRSYYSSKQIWKLDSSEALIIFSTSQGLCSINECKKKKIGGEFLVSVN